MFMVLIPFLDFLLLILKLRQSTFPNQASINLELKILALLLSKFFHTFLLFIENSIVSQMNHKHREIIQTFRQNNSWLNGKPYCTLCTSRIYLSATTIPLILDVHQIINVHFPPYVSSPSQIHIKATFAFKPTSAPFNPCFVLQRCMPSKPCKIMAGHV
jgi:hypothetical protein